MRVDYTIIYMKIMTIYYIYNLIEYYNNYSIKSFIYLGLQGTYGLIWFINHMIIPNDKLKIEDSIINNIKITIYMYQYIITSTYVIMDYEYIDNERQFISILIFIIGIYIEYGSKIQKYYTLKNKEILIGEGFYKYVRNPEYLGKYLVNISLILLNNYMIPYIILILNIIFVWIPKMKENDKLNEKEYISNSYMFIPFIL